MDFYKELLESFSRVKGRSLRILEQEGLDPEAVALATQAQNKAAKARNVAQPISTPSGKEVLVWTTGKGDIVFSNNAQGTFPLNVQENWPAFVAAFSKEGATSDGETAQDSPEVVQPVVERPVDTWLNKIPPSSPSLPEETRNLLSEIFLSIHDSVPVDLSTSKNFEGKIGRSERQIRALLSSFIGRVPVVVLQEGGIYKVEDAEANYEDSLQMANIVKDLLGKKGEENLNNDSCSKFKRTSKGQIVLFLDNDKGMVINGDSQINSLNFLLTRAKCPDTDTIDLAITSTSTGGDSQIRGTMIEPISDLWAMARHLRRTDLSDEQRAATGKKMAKVHSKMIAAMTSLNEATETWANQAKNSAVSLEDQADYDLLKGLFKDEGKLMLALYHVASLSNKIRKPDLSMAVGEQVGFGNKQDSLEMWKDAASAKSAMDRSNLPYTRVASAPASEIFKGREKDLQEYIKMGVLSSEDDILYFSDISYKTQLSRASAHLGVSTDNNTNDFVVGKYPLAKNFHTRSGMAKDPALAKQYTDIHEEQNEIKKSVDKLSSDFLATASDGTKVKVDGVENALDSSLARLRTESNYAEFTTGDGNDLLKMKKRYDSAKTPERKKAIEKEIKTKLKKTLVLNHLKKRIENPATRKAGMLYAAGLNYMSGASVKKSAILQVNVLDEMVSQTSRQNTGINAVIDSIKKGGDTWEAISGKAGITFRLRAKKRVTVGVNYDAEGQGNWHATQSSSATEKFSHTTKLLGDETPQRSSTTLGQAMNRLHELFGILKDKIGVMDL